MRKVVFVLFFLLYFTFASYADAKIVTVTSQGELTWNVLSEKDSLALDLPKTSYLEVKQVANASPEKDATISLDKEGERVGLTISSASGEKTLNLEKIDTDLIEIEERPQTKQIKIGLMDDDFVIKQEGVTAKTGYPIKVDTENASIAVHTETGDKYIYIMPRQAVESLLRAKTVTTVNAQKEIRIEENEGVLVYKISGEKVLNLFNVYNYPVEVQADVSATTGEIVSTNAPVWLTVVTYLLS